MPRRRSEDGPRRTCVACRRVRPKAELVRLVRRADGEIVAQNMGPGRGAYVCPSPDCAERLVRPGRLAQAFRKACHAGADLREAVVHGAGT
jgi:predicted RNA-binding protein YlxR (DUF448 family)